MKYKLIAKMNFKQLEIAVNELLSKGWRVQGGIAASKGFYYQAMIYEPTPKPPGSPG